MLKNDLAIERIAKYKRKERERESVSSIGENEKEKVVKVEKVLKPEPIADPKLTKKTL